MAGTVAFVNVQPAPHAAPHRCRVPWLALTNRLWAGVAHGTSGPKYRFQVPMQYCFLQHQTLLSPPDTPTNECHFCFGPATSFFLGLLVAVLHSSPVANWTPSELGQSSFDVISFCLFIQFMRFSWQVYWGGLPYCHMVCTYYNYLVLCGFPFPSINSISWWTEITHTYHIPPSSQQINLPLLLGQQKPPDR